MEGERGWKKTGDPNRIAAAIKDGGWSGNTEIIYPTGSSGEGMWQAFTNWVNSFSTYGDLSPDLGLRNQINAQLRRSRPELALEAWGDTFDLALPSPPSPQLVRFAYEHLGKYTGLVVGCLRPSDRLIEDLHMPLVCWFDWAHHLCKDFDHTFSIDLGEEFDETHFETVGELVAFLHQQLIAMDSLSPG